jgi:putative ATP-dependent endonuclease of OLD family
LLDEIVCFVGANNSGKSTILRAYEAAVTLATLRESDFCTLREGNPAIIELSVHIPGGTPNIDAKWKKHDGDLRLVRSRWIWDQPGKPKRQTFDPASDEWADEGKAAGVDQVFSSRLPQPFRIEALDGPGEEHSRLLTLILQPIADATRRAPRR